MMMRMIAAALLALGLAGCQTDTPPQPDIAVVGGPKFAASRFECGHETVPPDPGKAAPTLADQEHYDIGLSAWGEGCQGKLRSVGRELNAAGQVVGAPEGRP
jgi:hypothetical protein